MIRRKIAANLASPRRFLRALGQVGAPAGKATALPER